MSNPLHVTRDPQAGLSHALNVKDAVGFHCVLAECEISYAPMLQMGLRYENMLLDKQAAEIVLRELEAYLLEREVNAHFQDAEGQHCWVGLFEGSLHIGPTGQSMWIDKK